MHGHCLLYPTATSVKHATAYYTRATFRFRACHNCAYMLLQ